MAKKWDEEKKILNHEIQFSGENKLKSSLINTI